MANCREGYLVIGGAGFLGFYIVQALVDRGEMSVAVFGGSNPIPSERTLGADYYPGDIQDERQVRECLEKITPTIVFHTVSPAVKSKGLKETVYYDVNINGTRIILDICQSMGVKILVYTSSTSVVWSRQNISGLNEEDLPIPDKPFSIYAHSKGLAEQMANHGIDSPRGVSSRLTRSGSIKYQIGDNTNLVDYSYAGNIADAHILAADLIASDASPDLVLGEAFFLSDGAPRPYWDFPRLVYRHLGDDGEGFVSLPAWIWYIIAFFSETIGKVLGKPPLFARFAISFSTCEQWYSIEKARRLLGYEPRVSFEDVVRMTVEWWKDRGASQHQARQESRKQQ